MASHIDITNMGRGVNLFSMGKVGQVGEFDMVCLSLQKGLGVLLSIVLMAG